MDAPAALGHRLASTPLVRGARQAGGSTEGARISSPSRPSLHKRGYTVTDVECDVSRLPPVSVPGFPWAGILPFDVDKSRGAMRTGRISAVFIHDGSTLSDGSSLAIGDELISVDGVNVQHENRLSTLRILTEACRGARRLGTGTVTLSLRRSLKDRDMSTRTEIPAAESSSTHTLLSRAPRPRAAVVRPAARRDDVSPPRVPRRERQVIEPRPLPGDAGLHQSADFVPEPATTPTRQAGRVHDALDTVPADQVREGSEADDAKGRGSPMADLVTRDVAGEPAPAASRGSSLLPLVVCGALCAVPLASVAADHAGFKAANGIAAFLDDADRNAGAALALVFESVAAALPRATVLLAAAAALLWASRRGRPELSTNGAILAAVATVLLSAASCWGGTCANAGGSFGEAAAQTIRAVASVIGAWVSELATATGASPDECFAIPDLAIALGLAAGCTVAALAAAGAGLGALLFSEKPQDQASH